MEAGSLPALTTAERASSTSDLIFLTVLGRSGFWGPNSAKRSRGTSSRGSADALPRPPRRDHQHGWTPYVFCEVARCRAGHVPRQGAAPPLAIGCATRARVPTAIHG